MRLFGSASLSRRPARLPTIDIGLFRQTCGICPARTLSDARRVNGPVSMPKHIESSAGPGGSVPVPTVCGALRYPDSGQRG